MASFTVRVELHGATQQNYTDLHERMAAAHFKRVIQGESPSLIGYWHLPTAEYDHSAAATAVQVRDRVLGIAKMVKAYPLPWILVSEVTSRAWSTEAVQGHVYGR